MEGRNVVSKSASGNAAGRVLVPSESYVHSNLANLSFVYRLKSSSRRNVVKHRMSSHTFLDAFSFHSHLLVHDRLNYIYIDLIIANDSDDDEKR